MINKLQKKILVTGANGQLGSEINALSSQYNMLSFYFTDIDKLNITNKNEIEKFFTANNIDFVINTAAYTHVDNAEDEPQKAKVLNVDAVKFLAESCAKNNIKLIHISTDFVFSDTQTTPYTEQDIPQPSSVYGKTKYLGELAIQNISNLNFLIIRTAWLYSSYGHNFVKTMLRLSEKNDVLKVVFDQVGTPTYAADLAHCILTIISNSTQNKNYFKSGIYHYSNEGVCSWYDFAMQIFLLQDMKQKIHPVLSHAFPQKAKRPAYSVLNKQKIKNTFEIDVPYWTNSLKKCLELL